MLYLQNVSYIHPNKDVLFSNLNFSIHEHQKIALIGNNGTGKSTLLKIIAGQLNPADGNIRCETKPYYIPQVFGQFNNLTVAEALQVNDKLNALKAILNGQVTEENLLTLNDDWTVEERCAEALDYWQLSQLDLNQKLETLSGGQKIKVLLAGINIHLPSLVLLDEPGNHLDYAGRELLTRFIQNTPATLILVSHDRVLLNEVDTIAELGQKGLTIYGGNYEFYKEQKQIAAAAFHDSLKHTEKELRKAKEKEKETVERQQKLDARGKQKQEKAGIAKIMMNTLRNNAENSTAKAKSVHAGKIEGIHNTLQNLRSALPDLDKMKFGFDDSHLHKGKILFTATGLNFSYAKQKIWRDDIDVHIVSGERIHLKGLNGSGKTTLIKIILGEYPAEAETIYKGYNRVVYIDQDYSLLRNNLTVYQQALQFNTGKLQEHEIKIKLTHFLFTKEDWEKPCAALSGGERMKLLLCCLTLEQQSPDIIILDEPTNNLDLQNIEILTVAVNAYKGTVIVVSHDATFLEAVGINRTIQLSN